MAEHRIYIRHKESITDSESEKVQKDIRDLGINTAGKAAVFAMVEISGDLDASGIERVCRELLADTVAQEYFIDRIPEQKGISVEVDYKKGVTDAVADTVLLGLADMGISAVSGVKTGKRYVLEGELTESQAVLISEKILCNPMIQEYKIIHARE